MKSVQTIRVLCISSIIIIWSAATSLAVPPPAILYPGELDFGDNERELHLSFGNYSGNILKWQVSVIYNRGQGWVSVDTHSFRMGNGEKDLAVSVSREGREPGTYTALLEISAVGADYDCEAFANITMQVQESGKTVTEDDSSFSLQPPVCFLSPARPENAIIIENNAGQDLIWHAGLVLYTGGPQDGWVTCSPRGGSIAGNEADVLVVSASVDGLPPGLYRARIPVSSQNAEVCTIEIFLMVPFRWYMLP